MRFFLEDEKGATAIEYGLIVLLLSVSIIAAAATVGTQIAALLNSVSGQIP